MKYFNLIVIIACTLLGSLYVYPVYSQQKWNPGFSIGTVSGKYHFSYNQTPGQLVEIHPAAIPNSGLTYQWYSSATPIDGFSAISGATGKNYTVSTPLSQTTYYKRKTTSPLLGTVYSNILKITIVSKQWEDINYVREHAVLRTGKNNWKQIDQLPIGEKLQVTSYRDGLGRTLQQTSKGTTTPESGSSTWGDQVSFVQYDAYGRQPKGYLPYTTTTAPGKYKSNSLTEQPQYYANVYNETSAFSKVTFDNSPLNRPSNIKQPGTAWAAASGNSMAYDMNTAGDNVQIFSADYTQGDPPVHDGVYSINSLYKQTYTNENGEKVITYTDFSGKLILKKIQSSSNPSSGYSGWICVYSIYDDFGRLRFRLQPKAVSYLSSHSWSFAGTAGAQVLDRLCYQYSYDDKGRIIWKKAPGGKPLQIIYDSRDRIVFTQDGNQAARPTPQWTATLYDAVDRPTITALYNTTETRPQLQADIDNALTTNTVTVTTTGDPVTDLKVGDRDPAVTTYKARNSITFVDGFTSEDDDEFSTEINAGATAPPTTATVTVFQNPIPPGKLNDPAVTTILTYRFYDDYTYSGAKTFATGFDNTAAYSNTDPNVIPIAASKRTTGLLTGTKVRVLGTNKFLTSTFYYDEKGHLIQTLKDNIKDGTDVATYQYHFDGRLLSVDTKHTNLSGGYNHFGILTKLRFDKIGRTTGIAKKMASGAWKNLATYRYDDMGRLKKKILSPDFQGGSTGEGLEQLNYSYNIHNQITGLNQDYALKTAGTYDADNHFFGFYLGFDNQNNTFTNSRLDGHVTGQLWNSKGDNVQRKYDYTYDNPGRISGADFTQNAGSGWGNGTVDFSVSNLGYDLNGNITHINRRGLKSGSSAPIDQLSYTYLANSNRLMKVVDGIGGTSTDLGDFHNGTNSGNDYDYDSNGNLIKDLNKAISSITYNYLNLPTQINFTGKGNVKFIYDAGGNKLQKIITDNTTAPARTITTDYLHGFVYKNDTLQYLATEEGRMRPLSPSGNATGGFTYDYFVRDHLGDVRMVLTEQTDRSQYIATMEPNRAQLEDALFYNVNNTRAPKPAGYPQDDITTPNTAIARLNGADPDKRIGPSIILKVMAGDTIQAAVRSFYKRQSPQSPKTTVPAEQMLAGLLQAFTAPQLQSAATHGLRLSPETQMAAPGLTADDLKQLKNKNPNRKQLARPKAYLNYVFFDKQLNFVEQGSGVKQVNGNDGELTTLTSGEVVAQKDGFVYIFTSNESEEDVLFDNMSVYQSTGPLLEETHYYPFGQTMAGISTVAPLKLANRYKYNGKEFNEKEFSDGSGLQWYSYGFRDYDPQIGRFIEQDPLTDNYATVGAYQYALNDPIANIDQNGLSVLPTVTVTAKAVERMSAFSGVTSKILGAASLAEKASNVVSLASHIAGTAGSAINGLSITRAVGGQADNLTEPDDWYKNKKTGELRYFEGSTKHTGYDDLGDTYTGYVNISGKEYGFSGGSNGNVTLSRSLSGIDAVANRPRAAGTFGPYIPSNQDLSLMLAIGTLPFGGEGLWMDLGQISLTSIGRRVLFKAVGRGLANAAAQYAGNRVSNWNGGWIDPLLRVNWISVGLSAADINFGSNAILSGNLRFNFSSGFQSTLTGTISPLNGGGEMIGGIVLGRFKYEIDGFGFGTEYVRDLWWEFLLSTAENSIGY